MILKGRYQILKGYQNNHVTIGFGSYGQVKLAQDVETGLIVAVKIHKIAKNQVLMHHRLSHNKIIRMIDVHFDEQKKTTFMILEYAQQGTLYDKIKIGTVSKRDIKKYFKDICEGLAYLHSQKIMHRDIKPQNILITKNNEAKLCDFGFAALLSERRTLCGTYEYMSPQMIQNRPYDYKIDIWALGILLFELIAGSAPFRGEKPEEVLDQMKTKILFCQRFDPEDIIMVKTILKVTPSKRPEVQEILNLPYFNSSDFSSVKSLTNTQDSHKTKGSLHFLNESCNPKKLVELQKILSRQHHKPTYPPFYIPKMQNKIGLGNSSPYEQIQILKQSPSHQKGYTNSGGNNEGYRLNKTNFNFFPIGNKTFATNFAGSKPEGSELVNSSKQINYFNPNKTTLGYGRFS